MFISQNKIKSATVLFFFSMIFTSLSNAAPGGGPGGRPQGPPPEAIEACANLAEGDACSFSGRRGDVDGSCIVPRNEETLACAPAGGPPSDRGRPE